MKSIKKKQLRKILSVIFLSSCFFLFFTILESQLIPPLKEISHMQCKSICNQIIDTAAVKIIKKLEIENTPLLLVSDETNDYRANAALINQFCSMFSSEITENLSAIENEKICIPLGAATGFSFFANTGPFIPFSLVPMGAARVDYESDFLSVGINQINYKIWLLLSMEIKIVNPLYHESITLERKIMLVDLVFSGKVPEQYFHITPQNEYLLTE